MLQIEELSVKTYDKNGKEVSTEENRVLSTSGFAFEENERELSLRSWTRYAYNPQIIAIPSRISGENAFCCIQNATYQDSDSYQIKFTTRGTDAAEVIAMHESVYKLLVTDYVLVMGKPVIVTDVLWLQLLVKLLNKVLPEQPLQIVIKQD